jgi:hypothetical protein
MTGDGRPEFALVRPDDGTILIMSGLTQGVLITLDGAMTADGAPAVIGGGDLDGDRRAELVAGKGDASIDGAREAGLVKAFSLIRCQP